MNPTEALENRKEVNINLRLASISDAPVLAGLRYALRRRTTGTQESEAEFVKRCSLWMKDRLRDDGRWRCWVAEKDGTLVGNLWVQLVEKIPNPSLEPEQHAYITNFYVREGVRGQGIGSTLLSTALDWCKAREVHTVILWPTEKSRSLYLRHGFAVRADLLELVLSE